MPSSLTSMLLALDTYNRGYNAQILSNEQTIGGYEVIMQTEGVYGPNHPQAGQMSAEMQAGFFAVAYREIATGKIVVAYRGTDANGNGVGSDISNGYALGGGGTTDIQSRMAIQFYKDVMSFTGKDIFASAPTDDVTIVGHSMGAGHAGLIAALYNRSGELFDNMPFLAGAKNIYEKAKIDGTTVLNSDGSEGTINNGFRSLVYGNHDIPESFPNTFPFITNTYIPAGTLPQNLLASLRDLGWSYTNSGIGNIPLTLPNDVILHWTNFNVVGERHDGTLITTLLAFQSLTWPNEDWKLALKYVLPAMFNQNIGQASGAQNASIYPTDFASTMRYGIAYSAIESETRIYGDVAMKSLINDTSDLGKATIGLSDGPILTLGTRLGALLVEYAGRLAMGKLTFAEHPEAIQGMLTLTDDALIADMRYQGALMHSAATLKEQFAVHVNYNGGGNDLLGEMAGVEVLAISRNGGLFDMRSDPRLALKSAFIGSNENDQVVGTNGANVLFGGIGDDSFYIGGTFDVINGGAGDDTVFVGSSYHVPPVSNPFLVLGIGSGSIYAMLPTGTARMELIERMVLGAADDQVSLIDLDENHQNLILDGGDGRDSLNLLAIADSGEERQFQFLNADSVQLGFKNFEEFIGTQGRDVVVVKSGSDLASLDTVRGGGGNDEIDYQAIPPMGVTLDGGEGDDLLKGSMGDDQIYGGDGADTLVGRGGNNLLDGGDGIDTVDYSANTVLIVGNMGAGIANGFGGIDTLVSIENLIGTGLADNIVGSAGDNDIKLGAGDDIVRGGLGNDTIDGGDDNDTAIYAGQWIDFTISYTGGVLTTREYTLASAADVDGTDKVRNVETFKFDNGSQTLAAGDLMNQNPNGIVLVSSNYGGSNGWTLTEGRYLKDSLVATFKMSDPNVYDQAKSWSISTPTLGPFSPSFYRIDMIQGGLGEIRFDKDVDIDFETWNGGYNLYDTPYMGSITVTDWGNLSWTSQFGFTVIDVPEAPGQGHGGGNGGGGSPSTPIRTTIDENSTTAIDAHIVDDDSPVLVYTLSGTDAGLFQISAEGELTFRSPPDFEDPQDDAADNVYEVVVRATDEGGLFGERTHLITVANVNEAPTDFTSTPVEHVNHTDAVGTKVATLSDVEDDDEGDTHTFIVKDDPTGRFETALIDGEWILRTKGTGPLPVGSHVVKVSAVDKSGAGLEMETPKEITIVVEENQAPNQIEWLTALDGIIVENSAAGALVGKLKAIDPDTNDTFTYSLAAPSDRFTIVGDEVRVKTGAAPLDYETQVNHTLSVKVVDSGGNEFVQQLTVTLKDVVVLWVGTDASNTYTAGAENVELYGMGGADTLTGSAFADYIDGGLGNDTLRGMAGNDILISGGGSDVIYGGAGNDLIDGRLGSGYFYGDDGDDEILGGNGTLGTGHTGNFMYGGAGVNVLRGGALSNVFYAGVGADTFVMGTGRNNLIYELAPSAITVDFQAMTVTGSWADNDTIVGNFQAVRGTNHADTFISGPNGMAVDGGDGADIYIMGAGIDQINDSNGPYITGGGGIVDYRNATGGISIALGNDGTSYLRGTRGWAAGDIVYIAQKLTLHGSNYDDVLGGKDDYPGGVYMGMYGHDHIYGWGGNDVINAGSGNNYVDGGDGDDTITTTHGNDTVYGGNGNDIISVGSGSDYVDGGAGINSIRSTADTVADTFILGPNGGHLTYDSPSGVVVDLGALTFMMKSGSSVVSMNDVITGTVLSFTGGNVADEITGSTGDDVIKSGGGRDTILGLAGNDKIVAGGSLLIDGGDGNDEIDYGIGYTWGTPPITTILGGEGIDFIYGNGGNVDINGGGGNDVIQTWNPNILPGASGFYGSMGTIRGGAGQDIIKLHGTFTVHLTGDGDTVQIQNPSSNYSVLTYAESIAGVTINAVTGLGSDNLSQAYRVVGSQGADVINVGGRFSFIEGGAGNDEFFGNQAHSNTVSGGADNDTFFGFTSAFRFSGDSGADKAYSSAGNDIFLMGDDLDQDVFYYGGSSGRGIDTVTQFRPGTDKIVLPSSFLLKRLPPDTSNNNHVEVVEMSASEWTASLTTGLADQGTTFKKSIFDKIDGYTDYNNRIDLTWYKTGTLTADDFLFV